METFYSLFIFFIDKSIFVLYNKIRFQKGGLLMNKIKKFLLVILCILAFAYFILNNYTKELENMSLKVGQKIGGGELSMDEYYSLLQYFQTYQNYISKGEYKIAYNMLGASYRNYISYEEYEKRIVDSNIKDINIEGIDIITATTFDLITDLSGEKEHYSLIVDEKLKLYPESFLDYKFLEMKEKDKKVQFLLKDYIVEIDKCILNLEIKNNNSKEVNIKEAILYTNLNDIINLKEDIIIDANSTKSISLEFNTDYAFPENIILKYSIGKNDKELEFNINN